MSPSGMLPRRRQDLASSWGTPIVRLHMFLPTPAGLLAPDHYGAAAWPLVCEQQRLLRKVFRRSIAWLSDSLSTPRRVRCLPRRKTRFQLLVRHYWAGLYPQGSAERFQSCFLTSFPPFPSFLSQSHRPPHFPGFASARRWERPEHFALVAFAASEIDCKQLACSPWALRGKPQTGLAVACHDQIDALNSSGQSGEGFLG